MKVLAIGAHPDDIEFGCGGTLMKLSRLGYEIHLLILTKGERGEKGINRRKEQERSAKTLKARVHWGQFEDTHVPVCKESVETVEKVIKKVNPILIFVNYYDDTHQDHRAVATSTVSATRYIRNVLFYEVPTTQNFNPNVFVDINDVLTQKKTLLKAHKSQVFATRIADLSILDSAESTAYFRGYQGRVRQAEGFVSLRLSLLFGIGR